MAIAFCVLFAIAMILNTQMGGEALWFYYASLLHQGLKLYADLHFALQPLFVLEMDAWMGIFGTSTIATEIPSVFHALALCIAIFLILQESDWPDWQKAIVLAAAFVLSVFIGAYRFDDFHTTTDSFILFSLAALFRISRTDSIRRQFILATALGVLSAFAIATRLNDGVALLATVLVSLPFLVRRQKLLTAGLVLIAAALTWALVVRLTGDSFSAYVSNSIIRAAGAKGVGKASILACPRLLFTHAFHLLLTGRKTILLWLLALTAAGAVFARYLPRKSSLLVSLQLALAAATFLCVSRSLQIQLLTGTLVDAPSIALIVVNYLLVPVVAVRFLRSTKAFGAHPWDAREILVLLPLAELASVSASSGGNPTTAFVFMQMAMLLLLVPTLQPFRRYAAWANPSFLTVMTLLAITCMTTKIHTPYSWNNFNSSPMFTNRQWYRQPVYGWMYIDHDLLHFVEPVCSQIAQSSPHPELLSLPYSYPNYFCAIPPWHNYVQTYFDTSTAQTINQLMQELNTSPPQWIVYQRQLKILSGVEQGHNQGNPIPHRYLDELIMQKLATGQWQLVDKVNYLPGDGWFIIKTRQ
jgi:hypothetical protein